MAATLELLTENGLGGVSVDEVARRSGVAKTTIYRHWPVRSALILDACTRLSSQHAAPDTGSFAGDLAALMGGMAQLLRTARWASVTPSIIDAAERDPDLATVHSRIQLEHSAPFQVIISRAVGSGDLPPQTDVQAMIADLLGPLYYRRWFSREPLDDAFVGGITERVLGRT
ncbi:Transcriptional regulator, TetR family [Deinococcus marmoris]|uniref:Transcriptional regulator, TetR family n=2 Tax=Deinococcus marmoris TaxID=249408 RepID=A0A1U7NR01_9DEIO|nr:Transcriptional regulator, TetR family [Deinococcus marmoris]